MNINRLTSLESACFKPKDVLSWTTQHKPPQLTIQFIVEVGKTSWFDAGMKLKAPRIQNFFTAKAYLREFFEENKQTVHGFSYRSFASDIDWPTSYLHDVISGRKKFTVMRAMQLAEFLSLHSLDTERLIYFALRSLKNLSSTV